jgi:hypothetical protein
MLVILPDEGQFQSVEEALGPALVQGSLMTSSTHR